MAFKLPVLRRYQPNLERLRSMSLFSDLTPPELVIVSTLLHEREYLAGEVIFDEARSDRRSTSCSQAR